MEIVLALIVVATGAIVVAMTRRHRREPGAAADGVARRPRPDSDLHRRRAEAAAEMEEHDIDDVIDAIAERRRRRGRRDVGEELGDELMRGTWDQE
jgi:hypothetical protein